MCTTVPILYNPGDPAQGFVHASRCCTTEPHPQLITPLKKYKFIVCFMLKSFFLNESMSLFKKLNSLAILTFFSRIDRLKTRYLC